MFVLAGTVTFQLIGCSKTKSSKITEKNKASVEKGKSDLDSIKALQKAMEEMLAPGWHYSERPDPMGGGTTKLATTISQNTVSFSSPYDGAQHGILSLRSDPRHGKDVIFSIERGQFLTGMDGCRVTVRFDDDKPIAFGANEAADRSTNVIFISGYSKFVARLLRSKKVMIEAPFYQEGDQIFEFKVDSLKWTMYSDEELKVQKVRRRQEKEIDQEVNDLLTKPGIGPLYTK
jgi:hypothetical protein